MILVIECEFVSIEMFEDYWKVVVEISVQVLFFDFQVMCFIVSIFVDIVCNDVINFNVFFDKVRVDNFMVLYQFISNVDNSLLFVVFGYIRQFGLFKEGVLCFKVYVVNIGEKVSFLVLECV